MGINKAWDIFSVTVFCRRVKTFCLLFNEFPVPKNYGNDS